MPSRDLYPSRPQGSNTRHPRRRVKMRRRFVLAGAIVALAVAGAAVFASTASGTGAKRTRQQKTINVAVFLASAANTYWEAALLGAKDVAKKNPNVKLTVFDGKFNTNTQLSQLRDALVSKKYQAWFVGPNDGGPLTPTIKQAIKQGVKVGCALVPCGPNIRDVHVQIPGQVIFAGLGFYPNGQQRHQRLPGAVAAGPADAAARGRAPGRPVLGDQVAQEHPRRRDGGRRVSRRAGAHGDRERAPRTSQPERDRLER